MHSIPTYSLSYYAHKVHYNKQSCILLKKMIDEKICSNKNDDNFMINDKQLTRAFFALINGYIIP